jgi:protein-arginine kinase activator protein McsA
VPLSRVRGSEGEHRLEKLEFALAVALSRKDMARVQHLRDQIDALGGNAEEPGT